MKDQLNPTVTITVLSIDSKPINRPTKYKHTHLWTIMGVDESGVPHEYTLSAYNESLCVPRTPRQRSNWAIIERGTKLRLQYNDNKLYDARAIFFHSIEVL